MLVLPGIWAIMTHRMGTQQELIVSPEAMMNWRYAVYSACQHAVRALGLLLVLTTQLRPTVVQAESSKPGVPVIHVTDLHRPHVDPDDHWDLACIYALAHRGDIELKGILIDYPPADRPDRNPDIAAVAQMNRITQLAVPVAVGTPYPMRSREDAQPYASASDHQGIRMVLDILRESDRPVIINVIGDSRTIGVAGRKAPQLFAEKCAGIYLNAGCGAPKKPADAKLEYNVTLDKPAYEAIFDLPCPVYWMPCFESLDRRDSARAPAFGTHYRFRQGEILPHLSKSVQGYFAYMFARRTDHNWLRTLEGKPDETLLAEVAQQDRHMWCTAGFLHAAGYTITPDGATPRLDAKTDAVVFSFDPIKITGMGPGGNEWSPDLSSTKRFIFHVRDTEHYRSAVTTAMKALLMDLP